MRPALIANLIVVGAWAIKFNVCTVEFIVGFEIILFLKVMTFALKVITMYKNKHYIAFSDFC